MGCDAIKYVSNVATRSSVFIFDNVLLISLVKHILKYLG